MSVSGPPRPPIMTLRARCLAVALVAPDEGRDRVLVAGFLPEEDDDAASFDIPIDQPGDFVVGRLYEFSIIDAALADGSPDDLPYE